MSELSPSTDRNERTFSTGWPMRSMRGWSSSYLDWRDAAGQPTTPPNAAGNPAIVASDRALLALPWKGPLGGARKLPLHVLVPGFIVNTIFYALLIVALV